MRTGPVWLQAMRDSVELASFNIAILLKKTAHHHTAPDFGSYLPYDALDGQGFIKQDGLQGGATSRTGCPFG